GETVLVTDRDRVVAELGPAGRPVTGRQRRPAGGRRPARVGSFSSPGDLRCQARRRRVGARYYLVRGGFVGRVDHPSFNTTFGSIRAARRAGTRHAISAAVVSTTV